MGAVTIALWIVQGILAAMFLMAGMMKATSPEKTQAKMAWAASFQHKTLRMIGSFEILGAIGLIVPQATGIAQILTPLAAFGLAAIMVLAAFTVHFPRKEYSNIGMNAVLLAMLLFVLVGRF